MEKQSKRHQALEQLYERRKQIARLHKKGIKLQVRSIGKYLTCWGDESALANTDMRCRSFASAGKTLVAMAAGSSCQKRLMILDEAFNAEKRIRTRRPKSSPDAGQSAGASPQACQSLNG